VLEATLAGRGRLHLLCSGFGLGFEEGCPWEVFGLSGTAVLPVRGN